MNIDTPGLAHVLMASRTDLALANLTDSGGTNFFGPTLVNGSETGVGIFDARSFRQVLVHFYAALTGGTSPTVQLGLMAYDSDDTANAIGAGMAYSTSGAGGGPVTLLTGVGGLGLGTGDGYYSQPHAFSPMRPAFFRLRAYTAGSPTGLTAGRIFVYGLR